MTRRSNARLAGFAFLVYIATALSGMTLAGRAAGGEGTAAKLAIIAQHATDMRVAVVLEMIGCFCALVLAATLYAITRDEDPDLALLAMVCRVAEGVIGGGSLGGGLGEATRGGAPDGNLIPIPKGVADAAMDAAAPIPELPDAEPTWAAAACSRFGGSSFRSSSRPWSRARSSRSR